MNGIKFNPIESSLLAGAIYSALIDEYGTELADEILGEENCKFFEELGSKAGELVDGKTDAELLNFFTTAVGKLRELTEVTSDE